MTEGHPVQNLTINGGFGKVEAAEFRPDIIRKGKDLAAGEHLFNVREIRQGGACTIAGQCIREMSLSSDPYNVELTLEPATRQVWIHAALVLLESGKTDLTKLHGNDVFHKIFFFPVVCASTPALWYSLSTRKEQQDVQMKDRNGSNRVKNCSKLYPKGDSIQLLVTGKQPAKREFQPDRGALDKLAALLEKHGLKQSSMHKFITVDKTSVQNPSLPTVPVTTIPTRVRQMLEETTAEVVTGCANTVLFDTYKVDQDCQDFYQLRIKMTKEQSMETFEKTVGQSSNPHWFIGRKYRVTASTAHKIARARRQHTLLNYFHKDLFDNKNLQYGREMEPVAGTIKKNIQTTTKRIFCVVWVLNASKI
jgi:hypothetical protein